MTFFPYNRTLFLKNNIETAFSHFHVSWLGWTKKKMEGKSVDLENKCIFVENRKYDGKPSRAHGAQLALSYHYETILKTVMNIKYCLVCALWTALMCACADKPRTWHIGVSQCSEDIWRYKQNKELEAGGYAYNNVRLEFASADNNDSLQISQIQHFIDERVDLLVVAPNKAATLSAVIDRAYDQGIPVVLFDRKTNSEKYTAYMGADNYEIGQTMGNLIAISMGGKGTLVEITGLKGSSPAIERHRGFTDALKAYPGITVVASELGDWTERSGEQAMTELLRRYQGPIDCLFGHNDRLALGARKVLLARGYKAVKYYGVDALPTPGGGVECVQKGILQATYIYPTQGLELMRLALNILESKPYERNNVLHSAVVDKTNADMLMLQSKEQQRTSDNIDLLHGKVDQYFMQVNLQRKLIIFFVSFIVIVVLLTLLVYRSYLTKARLNEELRQLNGKLGRRNEELQSLYRQLEDMADARMVFFTQIGHQLRTPLTLIAGPVEKLFADTTLQGTARKLVEMMHRNMKTLTRLVDEMVNVREIDVKKLEVPEDAAPSPVPLPGEVEADTDEEMADAGKPEILVVDDNADVRYLVRSVLSAHYHVVLAANGEEGLAVARQRVPDLVVSDVMMPVMDGLAMCRELKQDAVTCHIPVVMLTARVLEKQRAEGYAHGADAYITKPFSAEVLLARIENLLTIRQRMRQYYMAQPAQSMAEAGSQTVTPSAVSQRPAVDMAIGARDKAFMDKFQTVVQAHLSETGLSVETVGSELGLSRVQLYRKVKALTGQSPVEQIRRQRLAEARVLLAEGRLSISEVAYRTGFTSPSYFSKCFKDEYGIQPGEARVGDRTENNECDPKR